MKPRKKTIKILCCAITYALDGYNLSPETIILTSLTGAYKISILTELDVAITFIYNYLFPYMWKNTLKYCKQIILILNLINASVVAIYFLGFRPGG